ncbi:MAG: hypothetical protein CMN76_00965 [Spirochaetaceae bacterium]|nr:hypothetical protein [Spirochaetaceae bacterium]|tara:strand:- start:72217 stop:72576 length:360 start_codon:yes stop_codon:yes gene_type:complete
MRPEPIGPYDELFLFLLQFLILTFIYYTMISSVLYLPFVGKWVRKPVGRLIHGIVFIVAAVFLIYWLVPMRLIHALFLDKVNETLLWPDVIFSGLALFRGAMLWDHLFGWLSQRFPTGA